MSKIPDYIHVSINLINEYLPKQIKVMKLQTTIKKSIPFGLSGAYDFFQTEICNIPFLIVGVGGEDDEMTPSVLVKQKEVLIKQTGLTPIFIFQKIASYLFHRYTRNNIDLVVGNRQLFLPSIFLIVGKKNHELPKEPDKVPVLFQLMVLYHLERENLDGSKMKEVADKLKTSYATVNRCVRWMNKKGFINLNGGKEKQISFNFQGESLWNAALPYLTTPVENVLFTSDLSISVKSLISEQSALAEYSLLKADSKRIAISKEEFKNLKQKGIRMEQFGEEGIEVWKYAPSLLSDTGVVDKLSLFLLLRDYEDERVQIELETMVNEIKW